VTEVPVQQTFSGMPRRLYSASPSKLLAWLDCPRRYRMQYLDRPKPAVRPRRAHTSIGVATHNALRDFWDLSAVERTPTSVERLVRQSWVDVGFRDPEQSAHWRARTTTRVTAYLRGIDRNQQPLGVERTVSLHTETLAVTGRLDRLDDRDGELVVVDYKTGRAQRGARARAHAGDLAAQDRGGRVDRLRPAQGRCGLRRAGGRVAAVRAPGLADLLVV